MIRSLRSLSRFAATLSLASAGAVAFGQPSSSTFRLPDFSTPDYQCDLLRAVTMQRQPSAGKDAYEVVLHDSGGAEFKGDLGGMVGWKTDSTVTIVGTITINPCNAEAGPAPIVIVGDWLRFRLDSDRRLSFLDGTGTVSQGSTVTKLPVTASPAAKPQKKPGAAAKPGRDTAPKKGPASH